MDKLEAQVLPAPPNLLVSLKAGFDAVANQIIVIIIPIVLDLILWLGPHLQVKSLILDFIKTMSTSKGFTSIQPGDLLTTSMDLIRIAAEQYNLLSLLRTIPVGTPSIMSGRSPIAIPMGSPKFVDITNPLVVIFIVIGLLILGLLVGSFFYGLVVQVALDGKINFHEVTRTWPRASIQVISLTLALLILFVIISIPSSCAISAVALFGLPLGQFAIFIYIGVLLWLAFPLIFSAHGIFVHHINALASVQHSMLMTRMTLPTTSMFIFAMLAIGEGLNLLWRVPPETSWLTLIGVAGHAFITSGLLASSFIYYRDADKWSQVTYKLIKEQKGTLVRGN